MAESTTDQTPAPKPDQAPPAVHQTGPDGTSPDEALRAYDIVSQTVGCIPSLRWRDNIIQAAIVLGCTLVGAIAGFIHASGIGALIGAVAAMVASAC